MAMTDIGFYNLSVWIFYISAKLSKKRSVIKHFFFC